MEYAETFGIRLLCEFEDTDQISDRLASYQPDEVRTFYQHVATENAESFCNSKDEIDGSYAENLQSAFGLSEEVAEHDIFSWFKSHLRRIAHFYTSYYGIYGAKKHAQRYEVLKLDEFETEFPIELEAEDTRYVLFVPKSDGEPVPIAVDARLLANYSFGVARRVRSLSVAIASKDQDDEKRELTLIRDDLESILDEYREFRSGNRTGSSCTVTSKKPRRFNESSRAPRSFSMRVESCSSTSSTRTSMGRSQSTSRAHLA
ncbi:hypothetical protein ACFQL4_29135 [Halosimplex aquaticum]